MLPNEMLTQDEV